MKRQQLQERFWTKIKCPTGIGECWIWESTTNGVGYGRFWNDKLVLAHRFAYEQVKGTIPENTELDHLCRNPTCVNPYHLEAVHHSVNMIRGKTIIAPLAKRTHCANGHELIEANCRADRWAKGERVCRVCDRAATDRSLEKQKEKAPMPYYEPCPECGAKVQILYGRRVYHERGKSGRSYSKHKTEANRTGKTVKDVVRQYLCPASGKMPETLLSRLL